MVDTMKAIVCTKYGPPDVLVLKDVEKPTQKDNEVLIKIYATSVTASDTFIRSMDENCLMRFILQLIFGFRKPRNPILGMTLSGIVESTGSKVKHFQQGDKVFAYGSISATNRKFGSYAEYICLPEEWNLLPKPSNFTHEQAASLPYGGFLALHCFKKGNVQKGDHVLIYGASGSIGTIAIQLAKEAGAIVSAVCSSKNLDLVKSLGADDVIDYTQQNAVSQLKKYDLVIDAVGNSKSSALKIASETALTTTGKYVSIDDDVPKTTPQDFAVLKKMAEEGKIVPVIDRCFPLKEMVQAHEYVDKGHKVGNISISVTEDAGHV